MLWNYKKIKNYDDYYITDCGKVVSNKRQCLFVLNTADDGWGYLNVKLGGKTVYIHRLVAEHFLDRDESEVNHIDGNKKNNNVSNLEWCSRSFNMKHAHDKGLRNHKLDNHPRTKLSIKDVEYIRSNYPQKTQVMLAAEFDIHPTTVASIVKRRSWNY